MPTEPTRGCSRDLEGRRPAPLCSSAVTSCVPLPLTATPSPTELDFLLNIKAPLTSGSPLSKPQLHLCPVCPVNSAPPLGPTFPSRRCSAQCPPFPHTGPRDAWTSPPRPFPLTCLRAECACAPAKPLLLGRRWPPCCLSRGSVLSPRLLGPSAGRGTDGTPFLLDYVSPARPCPLNSRGQECRCDLSPNLAQ